MKLHFDVTKESVEKVMPDITVGERAMLFEDEFSVISARAFLARFLCRADQTPVPYRSALREINTLNRAEFDEALEYVAGRTTDIFCPPDNASSS